jgi:hypothetical protein
MNRARGMDSARRIGAAIGKKARIVILGVWSRHLKIVSNDEGRNEVIIDPGDERGFDADGVQDVVEIVTVFFRSDVWGTASFE